MATQPAALERPDHSRRVHHRTAACIHQHGARLHGAQGRFADQVVRLRRQRTVQADDIAGSKQVRQRHVAHAQCDAVRAGLGIMGQQPAAETAHDPQEALADLPRAHDAHGAPVQIDPHQAFEGEVPLPHPRVGPVQLAIEGHHQGGGVFRHRVGRILRDPAHGQPALGGGSQVDVVEAGAAQRNEPHAVVVQSAQAGGVQPVVDKSADSLAARTGGGGRGLQAGFEEYQLMPAPRVGGSKETLVVRLGAENGDTHGASLPRVHRTARARRPRSSRA